MLCESNNPSWRIQLSERSREKYALKVFFSAHILIQFDCTHSLSLHLGTETSGKFPETNKEDGAHVDGEISIAAEVHDGAVGT
jgi:hypothetical protein